MNEEERKVFDARVAKADEWNLHRLLCDLEQFPKTFEEELAIVRTKIAVLEETKRIIQAKKAEEDAQRRAAQAEAQDAAQTAWLEDPDNQATLRGWKALKAITPNLDGVDNFYELPEALKYRYDAFRRAVENKPQLPEVKSQKQLQQIADEGRGTYTYLNSENYDYDQESFE
ncbi:hypothetical protein PBI_PEREGRIN_194 [Rhodococcus phage Peregrin]|nr:hypothetical protein PBI_PEREGRIN_194 [Rhodococcus phage Peregrin]